MVYGKRECPFVLQEDTQAIYSKIPEKRVCIRSEELFPLRQQVEELVDTAVEGRIVVDMECQTHMETEESQFHITMPTNQQMPSLINNNNNNSSHMAITTVCSRCQAGESGHGGHIGR